MFSKDLSIFVIFNRDNLILKKPWQLTVWPFKT